MTTIRTMVAAAVLAVGTSTGCAAFRPAGTPDPAAEFDAGIAALEAGDFAAAYDRLYPLYRMHWERPLGQRALLVLMAAEIDPRNPQRQLWSTADMASRYLQIPDAPPWTLPVAETVYLLAIELGAAEERVARAEEERDQARLDAQRATATARPAPALPGPTVPARLQAVETQRAQLERRVQQLEQDVARQQRELRERDAELERIRRTIRG